MLVNIMEMVEVYYLGEVCESVSVYLTYTRIAQQDIKKNVVLSYLLVEVDKTLCMDRIYSMCESHLIISTCTLHVKCLFSPEAMPRGQVGCISNYKREQRWKRLKMII